jgi:DNA-directed RNA polymerase I subunit RPA49
LDYTAKEDRVGGNESHLKHYIGVFDPATGSLSVMEAKKMAVRGVVRSQKAPEDKVADRALAKVRFLFFKSMSFWHDTDICRQ